MQSRQWVTYITAAFVGMAAELGLSSCENQEWSAPDPANIIYKADGRSVFAGDPMPIALDIDSDGKVDYSVFVQLTANSNGDYLNVGINPIGTHLIKSGPFIDANFLNMGFLVGELPNAKIHEQLSGDQQWTSEHGLLVLRHTATNATISYLGDWKDEDAVMVGIRLDMQGETHYGWLKLHFNKTNEYITLQEYAYNAIAGLPIQAGQQ